ncbi:MAG: SDR family oxidoreductase [Solirubrobacterales bacterium]|nr:SDR family oxidoreductase [Solirubrobacterales bacterium]
MTTAPDRDRVAFVTGGSSGMGYATAQALLAQRARVAIIARPGDRLQQARRELESHGEVVAIGADLSQVAKIDSALQQAHRALGAIDIVFTNAGTGEFSAVEEITETDFDAVVALNFKGVFFTIQRALPLMNDGGSIILNASWTMHRAMDTGAVYAASKAAVHSLARSFASSLAPRRIRVNSISPGFINTGQFNEQTAGEQKTRRYKRQVPLERFGEAEEIAEVVAFLASPQASYNTGQDILIDGGLVNSFRAG